MSPERRSSRGRAEVDRYPAADEARRQIHDIQRVRLVAAMTEIVCEQGVGAASVARVVARSGVSRRTFYELFEDRESCFLAAFDQAVRRIATVVLPAYRQPRRWRDRVHGGLVALLELLDIEPGLGRLVVVETLGAGPKVLEHRARVLAEVVSAIDEGRAQTPESQDLSLLTAEGVAGGVLSLIHARLMDGRGGSLMELLNQLMSMIVLPYLGVAATRRELRRPPLTIPADRRPLPIGALRNLEMRLTYRTMRVLLAIGDRPGESNRQVGDRAGIGDQGQISKLLARLEQLGLVYNASRPEIRGEPNAWWLTERGVDVREAISPPMASSAPASP